MNICPICKSEIDSLNAACQCGYDISTDNIIDEEKLRDHYQIIKRSRKWIEEVYMIKRVHNFMQKKHGQSYQGGRSGWGYRNTKELFSEALATVSNSLELADFLKEYPELEMCKNKNQAISRIKEIKNGSLLFKKYETEMELHVYLENNWEKTPFKAEWELCESHYHTDEVGEIDLLARHRKQNKYLVIELKKDRSTDTTVGQILRYMGWIKTEKKAEVEGLIISAARKDKHLDYALTVASNIKLSMYYLENNKPNFHDPETINEIFSEIEKRKHLTI